MVENLGRKLLLIVALIGTSLALLIVPDEPFRMGLDLRGGTRLVYSFDFDKQRELGNISASESDQEILQQSLTIIRNRVDPDGVLEPIIRQEGDDRIVIELPGTQEVSGEKVESSLVREMQPTTLQIDLPPDEAEAFPSGGGTVYVGRERIRYGQRSGNLLMDLARGSGGTLVEAHPVGQKVSLASTDAIRNRIENLGDLQFAIVARESDLAGTGTDVATERQKLETWYTENRGAPGLRLTDFNRLTPEEGGPHPKIRWFPSKLEGEAQQLDELTRTGQYPLLVPENPAWRFTGEDLSKVFQSVDDVGYPAVGFEFKDDRKGDFTDFTEANQGNQMAIVLNGQIEVAPVIEDTLRGRGIIRGRYTLEEVKSLITVLRSGSLRIKPVLEADERVGPSLGADYVRRGQTSAIVSVVAVLLFMGFYYRRLGIYSCVALLATLLMLLGGLVLIDATLTLPGIAGIILTIGMAVDANILIFDRIREEMDNGRNVMQAAKNGFDRALVTIVDANLTTLLTAIVLYQVGTGPVRGFAVTLSVGVLTSMFSALVITRVLVHLQLERGKRHFSMGTWLVRANFRFLSRAKVAVVGSTLAIVAGLVLFFSMDDEQKLGIDFLGGWRVEVRTEEALDVEQMRALVGQAPGALGSHAEVKAVGTGTGLSKSFVITLKGGGEDEDLGTFESEIRSALGGVLQRGPIEITDLPEGGSRIDLYFEETHPPEDVRDVLASVGLEDAEVQLDPSDPTRLHALVAGDLGDRLKLQGDIESAFAATRDSSDRIYNLALPFPGSSLVGPQVVGELRDQALLAIAFSLFATVMYIRVRFAEYSFGFAAVLAVLHDVLITLGLISLAIKTGAVDLELDLPLIAAFLTIIGYSLNDTIVLFDRIRENVPRMEGKKLSDVLDLSINQTLSRTILTSLTTLTAVVIMFVWNFPTGNVLVGFSFSMVVGVLVGTYSTIYIATPALLWLEERRMKREKERAQAEASAPKKKAG